MELEPDSQEHDDNKILLDTTEVDDESLTKLEYEELMEALDTPGL